MFQHHIVAYPSHLDVRHGDTGAQAQHVDAPELGDHIPSIAQIEHVGILVLAAAHRVIACLTFQGIAHPLLVRDAIVKVTGQQEIIARAPSEHIRPRATVELVVSVPPHTAGHLHP
jgi:hypothetical protein